MFAFLSAGFKYIFDSIVNSDTLAVNQILLRLGCALVLALGIAGIYRLVSHREGSHSNMTPVLIIMSITIAGALMLIGDNIARSFGLVGAVSIIRFRAAIKSLMDMAFIFLIIVLGMACGLGLLKIALILFFVLALLLIISWKLRIIQTTPSCVIEFAYDSAHLSRKEIEEQLTNSKFTYRFISLNVKNNTERISYTVKFDFSELDKLKSVFQALVDENHLDLRIRS